MELLLNKKVIVVTGGSKGIGAGIVNVLVSEGAIPVIVGRNKKDILKEVSNYKEKGNEIGYAFAELSKPDECEKAVNEIIKEFGRIDGLVNNAGINDGIGLENGNYEDFLSSIKNNLAHYYKMAQLCLLYTSPSPRDS